MFDSDEFQQLAGAGNSTGEVVSCDRFLVTAKGLDGVSVNSLVLFDSGQSGIVREAGPRGVIILNLQSENTPLGSLVVQKSDVLTTPVGEGLIGRLITPLCQPLDGKGPIGNLAGTWPVFNQAPGILERSILNDPLPTGVSVVDSMFTVVLGQRIAILGDAKSGKSSFLTQLGINQKDTGRVVVYALVGKSQAEINRLVNKLEENDVIKNSIVVAADIFGSLAESYIAPYIACAMAEYLWHSGRDVVLVYDDLSSHAKVYREVSLLSGGSPGRDSYPGDMFFAHSSLLERAGKLAKNGKTLTALPVVTTPGGDITAFLPTSIMSITDGQIIFDLESFRQNIRPAVNAGLSVSRVGGRAQTARQKVISQALFKAMGDFRQASELAHFGSDITPESKAALLLGRQLLEAFRQTPDEYFSLAEQQLILGAILASGGQRTLDIGMLKMQARQVAPTISDESQFESLTKQLQDAVTMEAGTL